MVPPPLTKQLLQLHHPDQKYSNEAIELSAELLKLFIVEARRRAKIEAECEAGIEIIDEPSNRKSKSTGGKKSDDNDDASWMKGLSDDSNDDNNSTGSKGEGKTTTIEIRADHIAKIAAELLLDLS